MNGRHTVVNGGRKQAQRAKGLSIPRLFTNSRLSPFDEVEWEGRSASISNEKGEVIFRQDDVETPKNWSQTATNIVASKYFHGKLGSAQRETSVRQLIGRVVNTLVRWGEQGNYFSTQEDRDAFRDELTHLLVQQKLSFNSPVWFNAGVEEKPQCSACQPYHALISTPEGMVPIGEIVEQDRVGREVYDSQGTTRVVAVKANGRKPVWRVTLRNGSFVEATPDHVVKAVDKRRTEPQWLRVDELRLGMRLHLHPHRARVAAPALVAVGGGQSDPYARLEQLLDDPDLAVAASEAALAGWLQADGFVGQYETGTDRKSVV